MVSNDKAIILSNDKAILYQMIIIVSNDKEILYQMIKQYCIKWKSNIVSNDIEILNKMIKQLNYQMIKQYHIKGEARDVRCHEKSISNKTYQQQYIYRKFIKIMSVTSE